MRIRFVAPLALLFVLVIPALPAQAHAQRDAGAYHLEIGWGEEPPVAGAKNAVEVIVTKAGKPVLDVGDGLKAEVSFGDVKTTVALGPAFEPGGDGIQGDYRALIVPTRAGKFTFRVIGAIGKQKVDISVSSGPETFDDVTDPAEKEFPVKDPSLGQLGERLDREFPRLESQNTALENALKSARSKASTAEILGLVGIVLSVLALASNAIRSRSKA